jgi:2'-5' RNA ligase
MKEDQQQSAFEDWRGAAGIFVLVMLRGRVAEVVRELQLRFDRKLAALAPPHITVIGSSGAGPIAPSVSTARLRSALEPVARATEPMLLKLGRPIRFIQTDTIALPLDPHGPLRDLHNRIRASGLPMAHSRHAFTPHVTLSLYPSQPRDALEELLRVRIEEPVIVDHIVCSLTREPEPPRPLLELPLGS